MEPDRTNGSTRPDTDVATRLRDLGRRIAPTEISDVWVFPPLSDLEGSSEFLLFTRFLTDEVQHLCGAEFEDGGRRGGGDRSGAAAAEPGAGPSNGNGNGNGDGGDVRATNSCHRITVYGAVPSHRVPRVVAGFRERLGDHREPLHFEIAGSPDQWGRLVDPEDSPPD